MTTILPWKNQTKQWIYDMYNVFMIYTTLNHNSVIGIILLMIDIIIYTYPGIFLAPAVTVGETEGAMDSTSVFFGLFFCL